MHAKDKFIAFIDIVGFGAMVEAAEKAGGDFTRELRLAAALGSAADGDKFRSHGPTTCPHSRYIDKDLDFQVTQISDCVVISAEVSPAGISNLTSHCLGIAATMLHENVLCRGYITLGKIHHQAGQFIGTGYMRAYRSESEVAFLRVDEAEGGTPFIQIDESVVTYVREETDACVREMFNRATDSDGTYTAIYPFKALAKLPSVLIQPGFDPVEFRESIRSSIGHREVNLASLRRAERDATEERGKAKIRHYLRGLEGLIQHLKKKEALVGRIIESGQVPYGTRIV